MVSQNTGLLLDFWRPPEILHSHQISGALQKYYTATRFLEGSRNIAQPSNFWRAPEILHSH
jgi:hypothetical protein